MTVTNEFERDLVNQAHLKRPGRVDMIVFQNLADVGDGSPGIQRCFRNYLHEGGMEKDLQLVGHGIKGASVDITNVKLQQLSNIETTTISPAQWIFVGGADQPVKQADSPTFIGLTLSADLVTTSTVDGVDVSSHTHNGAGQGGTVPFSSLSGDIVYSQLDSIVDISGAGSANLISGAQHQHTDGDGSSKITHANTTGRTESDHHVKYTDASALAQAKVGDESDTVIHGNDTERSYTSSSESIRKAIYVYENIESCKVSFDYKIIEELGGTSEFWLVINGIQEGNKVVGTTSYQTETNTSITLKRGDWIGVKIGENPFAGEDKRCKNFRIKYDLFTDADI